MSPSFTLPPGLVGTVSRWSGAAGVRWLDDLPRLVALAAERWDLTVGEPYAGGACALVLRARQGHRPVVLKVTWVDDETRGEPDVLRWWAGDGAVRLLDDAPALGALLLERLEPGTPLSYHHDRDEALAIAGRLARRLHRAPPPGHRLATVAGVAARWAAGLRPRFAAVGAPFEPALVGAAAEAAAELAVATPGTPSVVVNRDVHLGNVLAAEREPWLVIDPKPLVGDPAFDAGHLVGDGAAGAGAGRVRDVVDLVAEALAVDRARARAWALVRAVEVAVWCHEVGEDPGERLGLARILVSDP